MTRRKNGQKQRAIGVARMSEQGDREDERLATLQDQENVMRALCEREDIELVGVLPERDVSGGAPLERRPGMRRAVEMVEAGDAEIVVAAYFDRAVRSLKVQAEIVERVEAAGGAVLLADFGQLTNGNASQWLSGTLIGAVGEYVRRSIGERSAAGVRIAFSEGRLAGVLIPSLKRDEAGQTVLDPERAPAVTDAFRLRASGATVAVVRAHLAKHGIKMGHPGVGKLLRNRQAVGEYRFGDRVATIPATIDVDTFNRVQRMSVPAGRRAKSERLLARLGVLRCATCGSRMVLGTGRNGGKPWVFYRCGQPRADCAARPAIAAELVERLVVDAVRAHLADAEGRASAEQEVRQAAQALDRAQGDLDAALRAFVGLEGETAARERLAELRQARDSAQERVDRLGTGVGTAITVNAAADWERLTLGERRDLIRATVERVTVAPGRGADRVTIRLLGE